MMDWLQNLRSKPYFTEAAFLVGVLLLLAAWKYGLESLVD